MPTDTSQAQDRVLQAVRESQEASVQAVRRWSEGVATIVPRWPELFYNDRPEQSFSFAARLWASQWEFATRVFEAFSDGASNTVNGTAGQATRAASAAKS